MRSFPGTLQAIGAGVGILLTLTLPLRAAERITLSNGFDLLCDHRGQVGGRVRLYTTPGADDFLDVDPAEIVSIATVPNPPPAAALLPPQNRAAPLAKIDLHALMARAGAQHNLDVDLLASVVRAESDGNARAVSRAGARGLMQLMPQTAAQLGVSDSFRPDQNIDGGTAYLDALLSKYHDNLALALAAYNAGPAAVDRYHGVPPYRETRVYVARVIREFNRRKRAEILARPAVAHTAAERSGE